MSVIKTKNGIFICNGELERRGLAVAFNIDNFIFKIKNSPDWKESIRELIGEKVHTVLAQYNENTL